MRRITLWALSTVSALVLLFSYHTSTSSSAGAGVVALGSLNGTGGGVGAAGTSAGGPAPRATTPSPSSTPGRASTSTPTPTPTPSASSSPKRSTAPSSPSTGSSSSGSAPSTTTGSSGTFTGDAVMTQFGPVQVEIAVSGGKITRSVVTQVPWNSRQDQEINSYAVPVLNQEVVQAQSSNIDMVSGATYTSEGYLQSLQSAIDQANL